MLPEPHNLLDRKHVLGCWIEALIVQKIFHHKSQIKPLGCGSSNKVLSMFRFKLTQPIVKSCLTLCNPMDRSPPGPSVYGISQAKILEWVAIFFTRGFPGRSVVKNCLQMQEMQVWSLGQEDPLEKAMATHSSIFAWEVTWTEKPGGLQSMGSQTGWTWLCHQNTINI